MMRKQAYCSLSARAARRVDHHLVLAAIYLEDGARKSAECHIAAAQRILVGKSVPRGAKIWSLKPFYRAVRA